MNCPEFWHEILTDIAIPWSTVTGGCVRDWYLGLPVKDIDVFIGPTGLEQPTRDTFLLPAHWRVDPEDEQFQLNWGDYAGNPIINSIGNYLVQDTKIQIIFLNSSLWEAMNQFDMNLSRATYTRQGGLHLPMEFMSDARGQQIHLLNTSEQSLQRAERLLDKLREAGEAGWTIISPYLPSV